MGDISSECCCFKLWKGKDDMSNYFPIPNADNYTIIVCMLTFCVNFEQLDSIIYSWTIKKNELEFMVPTKKEIYSLSSDSRNPRATKTKSSSTAISLSTLFPPYTLNI